MKSFTLVYNERLNSNWLKGKKRKKDILVLISNLLKGGLAFLCSGCSNKVLLFLGAETIGLTVLGA